MPTARQVKKAMQPLLRRNDDLALINHFIIIKPVHHIQRGIFFERTSNAQRFSPILTVNVLLAPQVLGFDRIWAREVYPPPPKSAWNTYDPDVSERMCEEFERTILPLLRQVQTLDDFVAYNTAERFPLRPLDAFPYIKVYIDIARGDFDAALEICNLMRSENKDSYPHMPEAYDVITNKFYAMLMANDRVGLAQYLRECELAEIKRRKLEKFWEPTPFPLELQAAHR